jgi:AcrR family transcriptional regulator
MDDIAREADLSRATRYRAFPGGRDEALDAAVVGEVARFFGRISEAIHPDARHVDRARAWPSGRSRRP